MDREAWCAAVHSRERKLDTTSWVISPNGIDWQKRSVSASADWSWRGSKEGSAELRDWGWSWQRVRLGGIFRGDKLMATCSSQVEDLAFQRGNHKSECHPPGLSLKAQWVDDSAGRWKERYIMNPYALPLDRLVLILLSEERSWQWIQGPLMVWRNIYWRRRLYHRNFFFFFFLHYLLYNIVVGFCHSISN